jgi:hypothetical protein
MGYIYMNDRKFIYNKGIVASKKELQIYELAEQQKIEFEDDLYNEEDEEIEDINEELTALMGEMYN